MRRISPNIEAAGDQWEKGVLHFGLSWPLALIFCHVMELLFFCGFDGENRGLHWLERDKNNCRSVGTKWNWQ